MPKIDYEKCINCGNCKAICRNDVFIYNEDDHCIYVYLDNVVNCVGCGNCVEVCPKEAIKLNKEKN